MYQFFFPVKIDIIAFSNWSTTYTFFSQSQILCYSFILEVQFKISISVFHFLGIDHGGSPMLILYYVQLVFSDRTLLDDYHHHLLYCFPELPSLVFILLLSIRPESRVPVQGRYFIWHLLPNCRSSRFFFTSVRD